MTTYDELAQTRKKARPLYIELKALGLHIWAEEAPEDPTGYLIGVVGLDSLSATHADLMGRRIRANKPGLLRILMDKWHPDLSAVTKEGGVA